jgi:calcineurin-like phosphoesterase family protein
MHRYLIKQYNAVVPENGVCYFLGDVGLCSGNVIKSVIEKLNGTKVLILGNHDNKMNSMYKCGFDVVLYMGRLIISGQPVTMTHCPLLGVWREQTEGMLGTVKNENWYGESRPSRKPFTCRNFGQFHLHGHIHSPNIGKSKKIEGRQYDVGVDANKFKPVSFGQIESWIVKTLRDEKDKE